MFRNKKIIVFKKNRITLVLAVFLELIGSKIYSINKKNSIFNFNVLPLPSSKICTEININANYDISLFFEKIYTLIPDQYIRDYLAYDSRLKAQDYYSMIYSANKLFNEDEYSIIGGGLIKDIHAKKASKKRFKFIYYIFGFFYLSLLQVKILILLFFNKKNISSSEVTILRKKSTYDNGLCVGIKDKLLSLSINSKTLLTSITKNEEQHGYDSIFSFKDSLKRSFKTYTSIVINLYLYSKYFSLISVPFSIFKQFLYDDYLTNYLANLNSKIYVGVLHDKPRHILLKKNIRKNQKILTIHESFLYDPILNFDYVHVDKYYSMNNIERSTLNKYGGNIKKFLDVGFRFRDLDRKFSKGISSELESIITKYEKKVVITLSYIGVNRLSYYNLEYLSSTFDMLNQISKKLHNVLFIIKGKKGEIKLLNRKIFEGLNNIYIVESENPKELEFNQFEDLLKIADLVISMNFGSTTIWQSIFNKIPIIALNEIHPSTFLTKYKLTEVNLENLEKATEFWLFNKSEIKIKTLDELFQLLNINNDKTAIDLVCEDIYELINSEKNKSLK